MAVVKDLHQYRLQGETLWDVESSSCLDGARRCIRDSACVAMKCTVPSGRSKGYSKVDGKLQKTNKNTMIYNFP